jgi:type II secretory pathway pseudopilin PulG
MMRAWREARRSNFGERRASNDCASNDAGVSLVEIIVATLIFTIILSIITASIVSMLRQERVQNSQTNNLDAGRSLITKLDHQARYANAVSTPGTGTDGSYYVEFRTGNKNLQQTCTQWRFVPTGGTVQYRSWLPPLGGVGSSAPGAWSTVGTGFSLVGSTPIWQLGPLAGSSQASYSGHFQLIVGFNASSGTPKETTQDQVTITAINSARNPISPIPPAVCTENGRP